MLKPLTTFGIAACVFTSTSCFSWTYIGVAGGPEGASFSQHSHVMGQNSSEGHFNVQASNHFSGTGVFGSLFAGLAARYHRYYLAGEVNGNFSSVQYNLTNDEYVHQNFQKTFFTIKSSEGISFLPGIFLLDSTVTYLRIGYANGHVRIFEGADSTIQNFNRHCSGVRYGIGARHALTPQWALMMDYSQINYQHLNSHTFEPNGGVTKFAKLTPNTAQLALGITYNFA